MPHYDCYGSHYNRSEHYDFNDCYDDYDDYGWGRDY